MRYKIQPWQHQLAAIEAAKNKDCYALFFEQGTGKTLTAANLIRQKEQESGRVLRSLILCPQIVIENWKSELLANTHTKDSHIACLRGSANKRVEQARKLLKVFGSVLITNYEAVLMEPFHNFITHEYKPDLIILDESQRIKDLKAKRTKKIVGYAKLARYRFILSGTPITNSLFDIFPQFLFLDKGESLGLKYHEFRHRFFNDLNAYMPRHTYFPNWQPRVGAEKEIQEIIYRKAMRVRKKDCLDLPPFIRQTVDVEMSPEQARLYKTMEKDAVAAIKDKEITADLAIKKALRLQQIVTGFVKDDNGDIIPLEHNRLKVLREVIEQIPEDEGFIIWAVFKQNYKDIEHLLSEMGVPYGQLHGGVDFSTQQQSIARFQSRVYRAVVAHPASGGIGVNLTRASFSIFYSRNFSLEHDLQAEARNYRGGSEVHNKVTRIDLLTRQTIDELVLCALSDKLNISESVLHYLKQKG